jgi:hypothetical protein
MHWSAPKYQNLIWNSLKMLTLNQFKQLLLHEDVLRVYYHFQSLHDADYPSINYIGINFRKGEILSVKFYFAVFKKLSAEDISLFLPVTEDFARYYHLWEASKVRTAEHTGCTFEIKFKGSLDPTYGFHYRLRNCKESYDLIGDSSTLPFSARTLDTRPGINYEYDHDGPLRKRYYYLDLDEHKRYLSGRFKKPFIKKSYFSELAEFNGTSKVNVCRFDYSDENMSRPSYFGIKESTAIQWLKKTYGLVNVFDGFYEDGETMATYFFNTLGGNTEGAFDQDINFHIDTVGLFL